MPRKRKQLSGAQKLKKYGRKAVLLGLTVEQLTLIRDAAAKELRPVTQFITFHALQAARAAVPSINTTNHEGR